MFRKHYPDLDLLDSPLISANPFGTMLGVPGSAIAEKIFNDPESWQDSDKENLDRETTKDPMAWLAEELEKFQGDELSPIERNTEVTLRPFSGRYKVMPKPSLTLPSLNGVHTKWEGVQEGETQSYLPIFERSGLNLTLDLNLRLSKIWESGGNIFRSFPSPVTFSPPPSPSTDDSDAPKNLTTRAGISSLDLETTMERESSSIISPVAITSTSTTWSILELYGVPPTPRLEYSSRTEAFESYPPTPAPPVPRLPAYLQNALPPPPARTASPSITPLPKPPVKLHPPSQEATPIRRLPVIPDSSRNSSSPNLSRANTPEPPTRKVSLPLPLPPSSLQDPFSLPSITQPPHLNRAISASRSPPAGPRARLDSLPKTRQNVATGRESPFNISPAPSRAHRTPSPVALPPLRYGVRV